MEKFSNHFQWDSNHEALYWHPSALTTSHCHIYFVSKPQLIAQNCDLPIKLDHQWSSKFCRKKIEKTLPQVGLLQQDKIEMYFWLNQLCHKSYINWKNNYIHSKIKLLYWKKSWHNLTFYKQNNFWTLFVLFEFYFL